MGDETGKNGTTVGTARGTRRSKRGILWMLTGLIVAGGAVIYRWWRGLPR
jgi:hypothetical protein